MGSPGYETTGACVTTSTGIGHYDCAGDWVEYITTKGSFAMYPSAVNNGGNWEMKWRSFNYSTWGPVQCGDGSMGWYSWGWSYTIDYPITDTVVACT